MTIPEAWQCKEATDWKRFESLITEIFGPRKIPKKERCTKGPKYEKNVLMFRGQSSNQFDGLQPTLLREAIDRHLSDEATLDLERRTQEEFERQRHLHDTTYATEEPSEKIKHLWAFMRHHGAPTRVLDWTISPYVALYFAVRERFGEDAQIWWVSGNALVDRVRDRFSDEDQSITFAPSKKRDLLIFTRIKYPTARAVAQQGMLSMCENIYGNHADVIANYFKDSPSGRWLGTILIPAKAKRDILLRLRAANIHGGSLFPDLEGLAASMYDLCRSHPQGRDKDFQYRGFD